MKDLSKDTIYAAAIGDSDAVRRILKSGSADTEAMNASLLQCGMNGNTSKHATIIKLLVESGADVNAKGSYGWTPLIWASRNGHVRVARALLDLGADPTITDGYGVSAIDFAKSGAKHGFEKPRKNFQKIVDMIIEAEKK
jgi:ankyrin repeat protein